jgi:hypothetical protein
MAARGSGERAEAYKVSPDFPPDVRAARMRLLEAAARLRELSGEPMSLEEIQSVVDDVRREMRMRAESHP